MASNECSEAASTANYLQQNSLQNTDHLDSSKIPDQEDPEKDKNAHLIPSGWSKDEKFDLLQALKVFGSRNIEDIKAAIPTKTVSEIKQILDYYKVKALLVRRERNKNLKVINSTSRVPLSMWAQCLTDNFDYKDLQTETANALRLIAETEYFPPSESTENYDFSLVYHTIANAMEGKTLQTDENVISVIENCLVETAHCSKIFMSPHVVKKSLEGLDLNDKDTGVTTRPTNVDELAILRHLASQKNYNPLNIHENYLKPHNDRKKASSSTSRTQKQL